MKVTVVLVKAWSLHAPGAELTLDKPIADLLVENGRAEVKKLPKKKLQEWVKKP